MATGGTPELTVEIAPGTYDWEARGRTVRLSDHFAKVSAPYRTLRELDFEAVRIVSDVVARAVDPGRPVRLVDIATGSGRYLGAVNHCLGSALAMQVVSIGLDLSPPMLRQARIRNRRAGLRTRHLVGAVETLPFRASSCDVMTCFNAVHHFDLARFAGEASRVLTPSGQLVVYTRTPEQNRRTIWGRHFPEFATRETRLHEVNDVRASLEATGAFRSVRAQTVAWPVITSLVRLVEQVTHYHYSTFRLYSEDELRAAIDIFRQRVRQAFRDMTHITHDNDHVLVIAQRMVSRGRARGVMLDRLVQVFESWIQWALHRADPNSSESDARGACPPTPCSTRSRARTTSAAGKWSGGRSSARSSSTNAEVGATAQGDPPPARRSTLSLRLNWWRSWPI